MKVRLKIATGFVGAEHEDKIEIDDSEFDGMSEEEKEEYINKEYVKPFLYDRIEAWYEEITD